MRFFKATNCLYNLLGGCTARNHFGFVKPVVLSSRLFVFNCFNGGGDLMMRREA